MPARGHRHEIYSVYMGVLYCKDVFKAGLVPQIYLILGVAMRAYQYLILLTKIRSIQILKVCDLGIRIDRLDHLVFNCI